MVFRLIGAHQTTELPVSSAKAANHLVVCLAELDSTQRAAGVVLTLRVAQVGFVAALAEGALAGPAFLDC